MKTKNPKIKPGRPRSNTEPLGKYNIVYEIIPDDGQHIRFNDIAKKLYPMSKQTISAALNYGCMIGILKQERTSHKHVEYYKPVETTYFPIEDICQVLEHMSAAEMSDFKQVTEFLVNLRPQTRYNLLMKLKENNDSGLAITQAIFIKDSMSFIEEHLLKALMEYAEASNKAAACDVYINRIQFILAPLLKTLPKYVAVVGMSEQVKLALWKNRGRQHNLQESDFIEKKENKA